MTALEVGDIVQLREHIGEIDAGLYVILEINWMVTIARLGENEDGDLSTTWRTHKVTLVEAGQFVLMDIRIGGPLE